MRDTSDDEQNQCEEDREHASLLWQGVWNADAAAVVLECAFSRLGARELWACGRVCRAWRRTAASPALWRRLLLPDATPPALHALAALTARTATDSRSEWSWRKEYALENGRWDICDQLLAPGVSSVSLLCAALHNCGTYLALVDDDARLTVYEHKQLKTYEKGRETEWTVRWSDVVKTEWRSISSAQWAPHATSLLLGGRLALVDRFELLCINFDEEWKSKVVCRSGNGPGGAGCWVDDCNFLSMRLQLLAPGHACTTIWLNAASQETYSEFAGVTTPLLRIYNESATHVSHILVADVPVDELFDGNSTEMSTDDVCTPNASYYNSLQGNNIRKGHSQQVLIGAGGVAGGARGQARALLAWRLPPLQVPVLWVEDHLAQRVQQHRLRLDADRDRDPDRDREPNVELMRALCTPPDASCSLSGQILGIVLHPRGGCVWATTTSGAACVSVPQLTPLLWLPGGDHCEPLLTPHYLLPAVDDDYFITPTGGGAGTVRVWVAHSARGGARLRHGAPALAAFLLPLRARRRRLLVLTADNIYLTHTSMASRRALRVCSRHIHTAQRNKITTSGIQHNIQNDEKRVENKLVLPPLKISSTAAILCQRYGKIRNSCYELSQTRMYSKCGGTPTDISKEDPNVNKLPSILSEKSQYQEAARGRVATTITKTNNQQGLGGGALELQVPPLAETVRVRVLLDFKSSNSHKIKAYTALNSMNKMNESRLSKNNFQKKFTTCDTDNIGPNTDTPQAANKSKQNTCATKSRQEPSGPHTSTVCPPYRPKIKFTLLPTFPVIY